RQNSFFRNMFEEYTDPSPFDTPITETLAFNFGRRFTVPGSCSVNPPYPLLNGLNYDPSPHPVYSNVPPPQYPLTKIPSTFTFTFDSKACKLPSNMYIAWFNQINKAEYPPFTVTGDGVGTAP